MFGFIRDALREFEHVVWPTPNETRKYMSYNIVVIVVLALFLMLLGYLFSLGFTSLRSQFPHTIPTISSESDFATQSDLSEIEQAIKDKIGSGSTQVENTQSGNTTTITGSIAP